MKRKIKYKETIKAPISKNNSILTFTEIIEKKIQSDFSSKNLNKAELFNEINYSDELKIKSEALQEYWKVRNINGTPENIIPSPKSRNYRTTTKRKCFQIENKFYLLLSRNQKINQTNYYSYSELEPKEHNEIYSFISSKINEENFKIIGKSLNYVIIRGNYFEFSVIFNVHNLNAGIVRKIKIISEEIKKFKKETISSFIYLDPSKSEYYLESERPGDSLNFKKIFGPDKLFIKINDIKFSYHPTSFSQINLSAVPKFLEQTADILKANENSRLVDLYCGYGLFSIYLSKYFNEIMGVELEGNSIHSAIENSKYNPSKSKIRFIAKKITSENLEDILPDENKTEVFLLDPPRNGTEKDVIKVIAKRNPLKVLHIFCGIEQIPNEVSEWKKYGYKIKRIIPVDMFPGTANLEILILLEK